MLFQTQGTFVKQDQNAANLLYRQSMNPVQSKGIIFMLLVALGSITILAGCQSNPSASNSPAVSESPVALNPPAVPESPFIVNPATSKSPAVSTTPRTASSTQNSNNIKKAEAALKNLYSQQAGVPIDSVKCPENANLKAGGTFVCQAKAEGIDFGIQVKMENDQGKVDTRPTGVLILGRIEDLLQKTVKERAKFEVTADCGGKLRVLKTGDIFRCKLKDKQGQSKDAEITVKDEQGNIDIKI